MLERRHIVIGPKVINLDVTGDITVDHTTTGYKLITAAALPDDLTGQDKVIHLFGKKPDGTITFNFILPFTVTRRDANSPDYTVEEGSSQWMNEQDENIRARVVANGDIGWKAEANVQGGGFGNIDWDFRIKTIHTFTL